MIFTISLMVAFVAGLIAGNTFRVRARVWREAPTPVVETRFRVASKKGDLHTDDLVEVAQEIEKLRALKQSYVYFMDGRLVKQEGNRG